MSVTDELMVPLATSNCELTMTNVVFVAFDALPIAVFVSPKSCCIWPSILSTVLKCPQFYNSETLRCEVLQVGYHFS